MAICDHLAPNGEKSVLYQELSQEYGNDKAHDMWTAVRTQQFLNKHGDWVNAPASPFGYDTMFGDVPLDENGEPTVDWVKQNLKFEPERLELKPGMYANEGQAVAVNKIMDFLKPDYVPEGMDPELKNLYLLEGGAGVGKTTSINRALEGFRGKIIGATVSDEARSVLQQNMIGKETLTIAKLLGLKADKTGPKTIFRKRNQLEEEDFRERGKEDPIETARLVIIDEASMVDKATWQLLMDIKPAHTKIIFLGDRTQLPPIKEDISNAFSKLEGTPNYSKLTETMRFAEGAPIFQVTERLFADNVRHQQETGKLLSNNPLANPAIELTDNIANGEGVLYRANSEGLIDDIVQEFKNSTGTKDVIVIADKNETVLDLNKAIRKGLYGGSVDEDFKVGERIRMAEPFVQGGVVVADNNLKGKILSKKEGELNETPVIYMTIEFDKVNRMGEMEKTTRIVPIVKPGHELEYKVAADKLAEAAKKNKSLWRYFYQFTETFGKIDYAYAMTVHKVQGSTYKSVYVMEYEIYRRGTPRTGLEINQMMRTATSRPTTKLVIVTDKVNDTSSTLVTIPERKAPTREEMKPAIVPVQKPVEVPLPEAKEILKPEDIHAAADAKNIPWDDDPTFMAKSKELTNVSELSKMTPEQLKVMKDWIDSVKVPKDKVFEEFGTQYRFENKDGHITGEFKQGKGAWRPMAAKTAKAKYLQFDPEGLGSQPLPSQKEVTEALLKKPIPQNYKDKGTSVQGTEMRTRVPGRTSGEMIRNRERTETTRSEGQFPKPKIGDLEVHEDKQGKMLVRVTSDPFKPNKADFDKYEGWADEQWERSQNHFTPKWFSYRFEYLGDIKNGKLVPAATGTPGEAPSTKEQSDTAIKPMIVGLGSTKSKVEPEKIEKHITDLYAAAIANPDKIYKIPYEYQGERKMLDNGYNAREIANMMDMAGEIPQNIEFTPSFQNLLANTPRRIMEQFPQGAPVEFINRDDARVLATANQILIQKTGPDGKPAGYFDPIQQREIVNSVTAMTERALRANPALKSNALLKVLISFAEKKNDLVRKGDSKAQDYISIYNQRVRIAEEAIHQLQGMGIHIDADTIVKIKEAVQELKTFDEINKEEFIAANPNMDPQVDVTTGEFLESIGKISANWGDNTFELDPKDTASSRVKLFMGTLFEADRGIYSADPAGVDIEKLGLPLKDIATNPRVAQQLANAINRKPFWYKNAKSSEQIKQWLDKNVPLVAVTNFLGLPTVADADEVFKDSMNLLGDKLNTTTFQEAMGILTNSNNPTLMKMAIELQKPETDKALQNEFMVVMRKQYGRYITSMFKEVGDAMVLTPIKSNRYGQRETLIAQWKEEQKLGEITVFAPNGERVLDVNRINKEWIPILQKAQAITDWSLPSSKKFFVEEFGNILRLLGIGVNSDMMNDLYAKPQYWSNSQSVKGLIGTDQNGAPTGMLSIFIMKSAGRMKLSEEEPDELEKIKLSQMNNPLYTETTLVPKLAKLVAKYSPVMYSSNHRNAEGKSVYDWGLNTKLSNSFREAFGTSEAFTAFIAKNAKVAMASNNWLIRALINNPAQVERLELNYFDGQRPTWSDRGTSRADMSDREQLMMSVNLFQNRGNGFNGKLPLVNYMSLTHGDKTMTPIFHNMPRMATGNYETMPDNVIGSMDSAMYNVFKAEYDRITQHENTPFNNRQYEKGKGLFYSIPDFNYDGMQELVRQEVITADELQRIYPEGKLTRILSEDIELPIINKVLLNFTRNMVNNTLTKWKANGIVREDGTRFDTMYTWKLLAGEGIKFQKGRYFDRTGREVPKAQVMGRVAVTAAKDYAINHYLFNVSFSNLFYGDMAENYKASKVGTSQLDHVASTFANYTKRLAKDIAPRTDLYWEPGKRTYNTITLADSETFEPYLKGVVDAYADSPTTATDAQEITTVQEKLDVLMAAGQIPSKIYTEMSGIISQAKGGFYKFELPEHLAIIMQPDKPVYAGTRDPQNGAMFSDYVKSSSWSMYPPFTQDKEIEKLRQFMEKNNIQRANFESGKKIGNPKTPLQVFTTDGKWIEPGESSWQSAYQQLDRGGFGIQQEVPHDPEKEHIKILTQMNDNITEGIMGMEGFNIPEVGTLNGRELKRFKEDIRKRMVGYNLAKLHARLNIDENGTVDLEKLFDMMTHEAQTDVRNSYTTNEIQSMLIRDADGTPSIPPMFNTAAARFETMLMAIMNGVKDIKMPGKSYVQASSVGIRKLVEGGSTKGTIGVEGYDGEPLKMLRIENGKVLPAQIIIPFNFFANGKKLKLEDFVTDGKIDNAKLPKELLQLIAARIPNQKHSSMLPVEIVGFVPDIMGDIAFIPSGMIKQMGSDFDVDKLYTYKMPYSYDAASSTLRSVGNFKERLGADPDEWESLKEGTVNRLQAGNIEPDEDGFYDRNIFNQHLAAEVNARYPEGNVPKHRVPLPDDNSIESMQKKYFDIHWAILTHPDMIGKVLRPLDVADLEDESKKLQPPRGKYVNFYDQMNQLEDFQRGKDAKRLVGATSWAVKFDARIQDKNLRYSKLETTGMRDNGSPIIEEVNAFITVKDEHTGEIKRLGKLSGNGISYYTKKDGETLTDATRKTAARDKGTNHVAMQSEAVDNMNKRTLDPLNLTPETYRAAQAFIQLQTDDNWAANSKYWTRLLAQPIIKRFSSMMSQGNDSLSKNYDPNLYQSTIDYLKSLHSDDYTKPPTREIHFDPQLLLKAISMEGQDYKDHQLAAIILFDQLYNIGKKMFTLEAQFNQDVSGSGPDLFGAMDKMRTFGNISQPPIRNAMELYSGTDNELTEVGYTFNATVGNAIGLVNQVFPYRPLTNLFAKITSFSDRDNLSSYQQKKILSALKSYTYTTGDHFWQEAQSERVRLFYGDESLGKRVAEAKANWGSENPLLMVLNPKIGDAKLAPDYVEYVASGKSSSIDRQARTTGWLHLLLSEVPEQRSLGEDLLRYSLLTGGIQDANSFIQFLPASYLIGTEFTDMLKDTERQLKQSEDYENDGLIVQIMQHQPELAAQLDAKLFGKMAEGREFPESFEMTKEMKLLAEASVLNAGSTMQPFASFKSTTEGKYVLYMHNPVGTADWYTRVDTLGNQYSDEYNGEAATGQRSIFQENRTMAEQIPSIQSNDPMQSLSDFKNYSYGYGNFNNTVSYYNQIDVHEGGWEVAMQGLSAVAANMEVPQYIRLIARLLRTTNINEFGDVANKTLNSGKFAPFQLKFESAAKEVGGSSSYTNTVSLNPDSTSSITSASQSFVHEMMHNRTQHIIFMTGNSHHKLPTKEMQQYWDKKIQEYRKRFPEVTKIADELSRIRYEAWNALEFQWGEEKFAEVKARFDAGIHDEETFLMYSLNNVDELIAHLFENKATAEFLNTVRSSKNEGTLLSRIWKVLSDMLAAIGEALGVKVKDKSLLKEAIVNVLRLVDPASEIDFTESLLKDKTITVSTEKQAKELKQLLTHSYGREAEIIQQDTSWLVTFTNYVKRPAKVYGQRGKILDKLYEQKNDLYNAKSHADPKERVKILAKYREIKEQIQLLHREDNLDNITAIANRQLQWVDETLKADHPTTVDVNIALNITHTWENVIRILYGDQGSVSEVNAGFSKVQEEATKRRIELINTKAWDVLKEQYAGDVELTDKDRTTDLQDIDIFQANTLTATRFKPILAQATVVLGKREAGNRDEHIYKNTVKLQALEQTMKDIGLTSEMMTQMSDDGKSVGLVDRLTRNWYNDKVTKRNDLNDALEGADRSSALSPEQRNEKKAKLWNDYWDDMKKKSAFVDVRAFFDLSTGARLSGTPTDKAMERLTDLVGSKEYAKELVDNAYKKFQKYLIDKDAMKLHFDATIELTEEESEGKSAAEQEKLLDKKIEEESRKWLLYNSPVDFLNNMESGKSVRFNSDGDQWIEMAPRKENTDYYSDKFDKIAKNDKMNAAYSEYKATLQEMISYLPIEVQSQLPEDFLPIVPKDTANWLAQIIGKFRNWDATLLHALTASDSEEASRHRPNKIPIMYTHPTGLTKEVADRSTDLIRMLEVFSMMALQHKYMGSVLDTVNIAENIMKEVDNRRLNGLELGKPLRNLRDALKYWKDALIFKKPKELEGKINSPIYSVKPAAQAKAQKDIVNLIKEKKDLQEQSMEATLDGKYAEAKVMDARIKAIDEKLTQYEKDARYIFGSKIADILISINQQKALSYNPFSAFSNFSFAAISAHIYCQAGIDFGKKELAQGLGIMTHSMKKYWLFNEMGDETAQKVHALMNRYGVMGDIVDTEYGRSNISTRKKSTFENSLHPFQWQKSGDYFNKGSIMVAMMKKKTVEVTDQSTGEKRTISLWDAMDKNGKWDAEKYGENKEWYSEDDIHDQVEGNRFRERMRHVINMIHGNQDKNSPVMAKKNWLWRLAGQFRLSWFPEGVATRFKGEYTDITLGRPVKGRWKTYGDLGILNSGLVVAKQLLASLPGVKMDPFEGTTLQSGKHKGEALSDSTVDVENMRKNFAGLAWTVSVGALILMIRATLQNNDHHKKDDDDRKIQLLINMLIRNQQDLQLYSSPQVFNTITGNLIPATQVIVDYWVAMKAVTEYLLTDTSHDKHAARKTIRKIAKAGIPHPVATLYPKTEVMLTGNLDKLQR